MNNLPLMKKVLNCHNWSISWYTITILLCCILEKTVDAAPETGNHFMVSSGCPPSDLRSCIAHLPHWLSAYTWPSLHLTFAFPHTRKHEPKKEKHVLSRSSVPLRPLASTSTFHLTVTCDRPAMWDSRYCPSLPPPLTPPHPLPSLSSLFLLLLILFSWPTFLHPLTPHREWPAIPCMVWQREVLFNLWR